MVGYVEMVEENLTWKKVIVHNETGIFEDQ